MDWSWSIDSSIRTINYRRRLPLLFSLSRYFWIGGTKSPNVILDPPSISLELSFIVYSYVFLNDSALATVRDIVLDRTLSFMNYMQSKENTRIPLPIWLDQLSIDQTNSIEKEIAV